MKMTSIMLVLALVFACLFSVMIISHAANASDVTDATFADVIMNVGKDETERNLTWYSNYNTNGEVQYAKAENMTGNSFPATYSTATARVAATNEKGSYAYKATIKNLEADTRYAYRLVTGSTVSDVRYFDVKDFDDSFSFIYISDPQVGSSTYKAAWIDTLDKISESFGEASFIVSGGDQISSPTAEGDYDNFIVDGVSEIAIAPTNGPGHDNTALYTDHYNLPNLSTTYGVSTATSDYYYTYNNALFVHLNMDVRTVSEHLTFIENAIKNSPEALWHIVVIHWSFYSGSTESQNATIVSAAENMVGRMNELGVDLVLSGHDHFYARSQLVTDYRTVSDDVVVDNTVTNPKGTLYVCGSSATGNGITAPVSSEYSAYQSSVNRKSIINITVNEESLSLNAYFVDGATPELFDSFTINRTSPKVRVGFDDGMLKLKVGDEYISLVDAYRYTAATVKVIDGYWSISENGGASFTSLGIAATSSYENSVSLKINESTGYWQLSENGGASYTDLPINVKRYTVTYVTDKEPYPDLSVYSTSTYVEGMLPDPPAIVLPAGSFDEGVFYEWSWEFKNSDGTSATSFTAGNEYIAYITADISRISSNLYIGATTNESEGIYTWGDAWNIAIEFPDEAFTFTLTQNVTATATITLVSKTSVTVDLAGYTLKTSGTSYAINYNTGSTGSSFSLVSSKAGGTVNSKSFVCLTTSQVSNVNVSYGSDDGYPITLNANDSTYGYLLFAGGNFKRGSTVNFSIKNGTYTATNGIIYVDNAEDALSAANHYKVDIDNANITLGKSPVCFKGARKASASSFMNVTDSSISISSGTAPVIASDQWYGSFSFTGCDINGVTFPESGITNITGATFGDGTTFTNSDETFNSDKTAFASAKLSLNANCSIRNNGGTLEIYEGEKLPDNVLLISKTSNESEGVYTWADAWAIAIKFPDEKFTFVLNENVSLSATTTLTSKTDVTVDLAGYTLTTTSSYAINYNTGSTGSSFALISSKAGGTVKSKSLVCLTTSQVSSVNVSYGSDDGYPITLNANDSTYGYLLFAGGNFKRGSTVNFSIKNGTYTATNGILYVDNAADDLSAANHYKINISGSDITLGKSPVCFKGARKASASSFMNVTDSSISISSGTAPVIASDQWYGSFSFTGCDISGVTFPESGITNITGATFGDGTTFTNSDETFNSDKTAFASAKLSLNANCSIRNNGGTLEIYEGEKLPDNVLLISKTSNNAESLYTWNEAWNKAMANPSVSYIFRLTENTNLGGSQLIEIKAKCNVTVDLAGYAIKVSTNSNYLVAYGNGSTGSSFSLISSTECGSYYGPTLVLASSSGASSLTFNIGSADSYPITVTTFKTASPYSSKGSLFGVNGNFKNGSTLTATVTNGTYVLEGEILSTNNYSGNLNTFKINISGADITVGTAVISFASTHNTTATSYFNVENATITASADTLSFTGANQWYGSLEFANCEFNGIVFDAAMLSNISGGIFKSGCSFTNYGDSFNGEFSAFACDKLACESGFTLTVDANGTVTIDEVCPHHTKVTIIGKAPTCTNTGLTDGVKCASCGDIITAQETIPALGHSYNAVVTNPDCVNGGYTTYTCSVCGDSYIGNATNALGHIANDPTLENVVNATCTEDGGYDTVVYCSVCDAEISRVHTIVSASGHNYNAVVTAPDCVNGGYTTYTCSVCGDSYIGNSVSATGHTSEIIPGKAPTCTDTGLTDGAKCSTCGDILTAQTEIPANGHTDDNNNYICDVCGEDLCTNHNETSIEGKAPTCTNTGLTDGVKCANCGDIIVAQETIPALGHSYNVVVTDPDCTNAGYTTYTCSICGDTYVADEVQALGHDYEAVVTAPICTEKGYTTYTCSVCGNSYIADEVQSLGHNYEAVVTAPDCTNSGYTTYTCTACNNTYIADETEVNGHEWKDATTESPKTCEKCGETEGEKLPILESETNHDECEENANGWSKFWTAICNFFRRIFGLKEQCYCGKELDL